MTVVENIPFIVFDDGKKSERAVIFSPPTGAF